jgi:hypothetical protein
MTAGFDKLSPALLTHLSRFMLFKDIACLGCCCRLSRAACLVIWARIHILDLDRSQQQLDKGLNCSDDWGRFYATILGRHMPQLSRLKLNSFSSSTRHGGSRDAEQFWNALLSQPVMVPACLPLLERLTVDYLEHAVSLCDMSPNLRVLKITWPNQMYDDDVKCLSRIGQTCPKLRVLLASLWAWDDRVQAIVENFPELRFVTMDHYSHHDTYATGSPAEYDTVTDNMRLHKCLASSKVCAVFMFSVKSEHIAWLQRQWFFARLQTVYQYGEDPKVSHVAVLHGHVLTLANFDMRGDGEESFETLIQRYGYDVYDV